MWTTRQRRTYTKRALYGVIVLVLFYGGYVFARPLVREMCICLPATHPFVPLSEEDLNEAIPPATVLPDHPCCERP